MQKYKMDKLHMLVLIQRIMDNGKWIIDTTGNWTYVCFQKDEFTQTIFGYVVEQTNGKYKAWHGFDKESEKYFDNVEDGIEYVKSL